MLSKLNSCRRFTHHRVCIGIIPNTPCRIKQPELCHYLRISPISVVASSNFGTSASHKGLFGFWKAKEETATVKENVIDLGSNIPENGVNPDTITSSPLQSSVDGVPTTNEGTTLLGNIENPISDETMEALTSSADAVMQFSDYGLGGGILPHKLFQDILNYLTTTVELDWIPAIALLALCLRILTVPGAIAIRRFSARTHNLYPETLKKMEAMQDATAAGNNFLYKKAMMDYMSHMSENNINPIRAMLVNIPNGIIFMSMFMGIRQICVAKLPSMVNGGALWFTNLTIPDPYFVLPLCACLSMSAIIRFGGAEAEMGPLATMDGFRKVLMWLPVVSLPFLVFQPAAMFAFWIVSNSFTYVLMTLFKKKSFSRFCGIPDKIQHSNAVNTAMAKSMNPMEIYKKTKQKQAEHRELVKKVENYQNLIKQMKKMEEQQKRRIKIPKK